MRWRKSFLFPAGAVVHMQKEHIQLCCYHREVTCVLAEGYNCKSTNRLWQITLRSAEYNGAKQVSLVLREEIVQLLFPVYYV